MVSSVIFIIKTKERIYADKAPNFRLICFNMNEDILQDYSHRAASAQNEADKFKRLVNLYSFMRLGIFIMLLLFIAIAVKQESYLIFAISLITLGGGFAWLVKRQSIFEAQREYYQHLKKVCENEIDSIVNR